MTPEQFRRAAELLRLDAVAVRDAAEYHEHAASVLRAEEAEFESLAAKLNAQADAPKDTE